MDHHNQKKCPDCGKEAPDTLYFCPQCGCRLVELPPEGLNQQKASKEILVGIEQTPVSALPFCFDGLEDEYGPIQYAEILCPGVYFIVAKAGKNEFPPFSREYLAVTEDSPAISSQARAYGAALPTVPKVWLYDYDYFSKGKHIVEYEAHRYLAEQGIPLPRDCSLIEDRSFGMEVCPEYFGEFPIPTETPWGAVLRHDRLWNGLYWLETAAAGWTLAVAYPFCGGLWSDTLELAALMEYDRANGIENTCGYRFFTYESSCLPLYKLEFGEENPWTEKIDDAALQNAILNYFPQYGSGDGHSGPCFSMDEQIQPTPGAGTDFYSFP